MTDLVGILEENVFTLGLFESQIGDSSNDTPTIREVDVVLLSEIARFRGLSTEDDVSGSISRSRSGNPSTILSSFSQCWIDERVERKGGLTQFLVDLHRQERIVLPIERVCSSCSSSQ